MIIASINIARLHPIIVHAPIGIMLFVAILEIGKRRFKITSLEKATSIALLWGFISSVFTITTGLLLADQGVYNEETLLQHKTLGIITCGLLLLLYLGYTNRVSFLKRIYGYLLPVSILTVMITGHFGGTLTHGPGYLFSKPNSDSQITETHKQVTRHTVEIKGMKFIPNHIEVDRGDTIVFVNKDFVPHDVTEEATRKWSSSILQSGDSWVLIADESLDYFCSLHIVMKGRIRVRL